VQLTDLAAGYGKQPQLININLTVAANHSLSIIGVNGAGKTTLLKCLIGLHRPSAGTVRLAGGDPARRKTRAGFAFLPERFAPSPLLTGFEILRLTRLSYGLAFDRDTAISTAAGLGLPADLLRRRVRTYSKGTLQKLGLAAALHAGRKLLILDEPFSGLDPVARVALRDVLQAYREQGGSLIFTSHTLADLAMLADRVAMLAGGTLAFNGTPAEFMALDPGNNPEAAFLNLAKSAA
jgi:ABC-2 type transport system ATP-binding protein